MDKAAQKEAKAAYRLAFPAMGIYGIRHLDSGRMLLDKSTNLPGALNRHRMELKLGTHRNRALQADWLARGEAGFAFEILEQIKESSDPDMNYARLLDDLLATWLSRLPRGSPGSYL